MPCRSARSSTMATKYSGTSRAMERLVKTPVRIKLGDVLYKRLEFGAVVSLDVIDELRGAGIALGDQSFLPHRLEMVARHIRLARGYLGLGLLDQGFLQAFLLLDVVDCRAGCHDISLGLIKLGAVIVVDDLDEDVAAMNALEVLH
jgi:hypothetical protein